MGKLKTVRTVEEKSIKLIKERASFVLCEEKKELFQLKMNRNGVRIVLQCKR